MDGITEFFIETGTLAGSLKLIGDVDFVQDEMNLDSGCFSRHKRARYKVVGKAGFRGNDNEQLVDIGREQFGFILVRTI